MKSPYLTITADQEVDQTRGMRALLEEAGWQFRLRERHVMRTPFSKLREVARLIFGRRVRQLSPFGEVLVWENLEMLAPLANFEYEKSFLTLVRARNLRSLREHGLTENVDINAVLEMCL